MSLIPHTFLPRSMFDMDAWFRPAHLGFGPSTLDMFDPFDELDRTMSRNLMWLNKPDFLDTMPKIPSVPHKYRISLDCRGFSPKSLKTEFKDGKFVVSASEVNKTGKETGGDFSVREFKKTYKLPYNVETDKMVSFMTTNGYFVVEMPLKEEHDKSFDSFMPQIISENGQKTVSVKLSLPKNIDPAKISVTCKDRDLIIKAEDKEEKPDSYSQTYYYQHTTLPENTDFQALKCIYDTNHLFITAPIHSGNYFLKDSHKFPVEFKKSS